MPAYNYSILLNVPVPSSTARRLVATVIARLLKQLVSQHMTVFFVVLQHSVFVCSGMQHLACK